MASEKGYLNPLRAVAVRLIFPHGLGESMMVCILMGKESCSLLLLLFGQKLMIFPL